MIFLADENISHRAAHMLDWFDKDNEIRAHKDHFEPGTSDVVWIREVGTWNPKPVILGGDARILRNKVEKATLREADLMFVYLAGGWIRLAWPEFAWKLVRAWPHVAEAVKAYRHPTLLEVPISSQKIMHRGRVAELGK